MRESIKLRLRVTVCIRSKEKPPRRELTHRFHLWFVMACSKCPCMGKLSPVCVTQVCPLTSNLSQKVKIVNSMCVGRRESGEDSE